MSIHLQEVLLGALLDLDPEDEEACEPALDAVGVVEGLRDNVVLMLQQVRNETLGVRCQLVRTHLDSERPRESERLRHTRAGKAGLKEAVGG